MIYQLRVLVICLAFITLGLLLAGCRDDATATQKIAIGCASAATAIRVLSAVDDAGGLSDESRDAVLQAIAVTEPVCRRPTPPSLTDIELIAFARAASFLEAIASSAPAVEAHKTGYRL